MKHIPSPRTLLIVAIAGPAVWLFIWLLISLIPGTPRQSTGELSALLATIGGIMGAIFTVGGLILALVAVLSQITLEDRAKRVLEEKFNELAPELEKRADRRIAGRIAFRDAQQALNEQAWDAAEALANEALANYPSLPEVRSTVALAMYAAVEQRFRMTLEGIQDPMAPLYRVETAFLSRAPQPPELREPPIAQTVEWLSEAWRHQDNPEGAISAARALVYAITSAYDKMLDAIRESLSFGKERFIAYFTTSLHLGMLAYACDNDPDRIKLVGTLLDIELPAGKDTVVASIKRADYRATKQDFIDWYAAERDYGPHPSRYVAVVRFFQLRDAERGMLAQAGIMRQGTAPVMIPSGTEQYLPIGELVTQLTEQYYFLCPVVSPREES